MSDTNSAQAPEILPITDLDQFAGLLTNWHASKVAVLEHMLSIPEGTEMSIDGGDSVPLTGDLLAGLKVGINLCLMELGNLPFITESANAADAPTPH